MARITIFTGSSSAGVDAEIACLRQTPARIYVAAAETVRLVDWLPMGVFLKQRRQFIHYMAQAPDGAPFRR